MTAAQAETFSCSLSDYIPALGPADQLPQPDALLLPVAIYDVNGHVDARKDDATAEGLVSTPPQNQAGHKRVLDLLAGERPENCQSRYETRVQRRVESFVE